MACVCFRGCGSPTTFVRVTSTIDKTEDGEIILCAHCGGLIESQPTAREQDVRALQEHALSADNYCADAALPELTPEVLAGMGASPELLAAMAELSAMHSPEAAQ